MSVPKASRIPAGDKGTADRIEADEGAYWVRLVTRQALDREGAAMGHCVGDGGYDCLVGGEEIWDDSIWSLRRADGVSILTVRVQEHEIDYARGPLNHEPGRGAAMQLRHLVAGYTERSYQQLLIDEDTGITLVPDGRTFRLDRLPPDVAAAREASQASRRALQESRRVRALERDFDRNVGCRIERVEIRTNENPRRSIIDTPMYRATIHPAIELTANEPDPIVDCWHEFDTGREAFRTRSGIRFSAGNRFSLMGAGSRDILQAYRAAIARADADRASAQPPADADPVTFTAARIRVGDAVKLGFPDGRGAYNVTDVEVRTEHGVPLSSDRYAVDGALGIIQFLDNHASLTVRFRAGEQPVPVTIAPGLQVISEPITFEVADPGTVRSTASWCDHVFRNAGPLHLTGVQARIVDAIVTSVTSDGFEARWEGGLDTIEQALALVAQGPGQPTTAEPPS